MRKDDKRYGGMRLRRRKRRVAPLGPQRLRGAILSIRNPPQRWRWWLRALLRDEIPF